MQFSQNSYDDDENERVDNNGCDDGTQFYIGSPDLSEYSSCGKQTSSIQHCSGCGLVGSFFLDPQRILTGTRDEPLRASSWEATERKDQQQCFLHVLYKFLNNCSYNFLFCKNQ